MRLGHGRVSLAQFHSAASSHQALYLDPAARERITAAHAHVQQAAAADEPIYGLNTGLGAKLQHRIAPNDIAAFQHQILAGRAVACGEPLPDAVSRGALLARLISAASGFSGMSPSTFDHLLAVYNAGLSPVIPSTGSIGAADLTQNAHAGLALFGEGSLWCDGVMTEAGAALSRHGLVPPALQPKDGLALASHSGLSASLAGHALHAAQTALATMRHAIVLAYSGFDANQSIFDARSNALRPAPGQCAAAAWFREALAGSSTAPRRVQEPLSFRTVAPVVGAATHALETAIATWEDELNGSSDSPAVLESGEMLSTPNFYPQALTLHLQTLGLALVSVASASVQRMQRLMNPDLSGLPRYLSPDTAQSAGLVPTQKTAAALLSEIAQHAQPVALSPAPVSDAVEDVAPLTPQAASSLSALCDELLRLAALEAIVACQAIDLRKPDKLSAVARQAYDRVRESVARLSADRPLGADIEKATEALRHHCEYG